MISALKNWLRKLFGKEASNEASNVVENPGFTISCHPNQSNGKDDRWFDKKQLK